MRAPPGHHVEAELLLVPRRLGKVRVVPDFRDLVARRKLLPDRHLDEDGLPRRLRMR